MAEEIVAESQSMLALPNSESADATLDSAFEEVTEEQRAAPRARPNGRLKAVQTCTTLQSLRCCSHLRFMHMVFILCL